MVKFRWEKEFKETPIGKIPKDWEVKKLGEFVIKAKTGGTPPTKREEYWNGEIPWVTSNHLKSLYVSKGERTVTEKAIRDKKTSLAKKGSVLFGTRIGIGNVSIAKRDVAFNQDVTAVWLDNRIHKEYLVRAIKSPFYQELLNNIADGTTVGGLDRDTLLNILLPYPSPDEQERIATVLSWFDDLIENKRRQNEILEKVAMAIFKSWFIDFEPFQDEEFVYSEELDMEIPKGWEVGKLVEIGEIIMGQSPPSKAYNLEGDGYPFVQGMGQFGLYVPNTDTYSKVVTKLSKPYDVLITVRAPIGELNIADRCYILGRGVSAIRSEFWPFVYLYLKVFNELLKSYERGTTFEAITKSELENFPVLIPPKPILEKFHSLVEPLFRKIIINEKEIMVLKKARDTLLPQLVFGRLRVEEV